MPEAVAWGETEVEDVEEISVLELGLELVLRELLVVAQGLPEPVTCTEEEAQPVEDSSPEKVCFGEQVVL